VNFIKKRQQKLLPKNIHYCMIADRIQSNAFTRRQTLNFNHLRNGSFCVNIVIAASQDKPYFCSREFKT
jgi:hypothetical protein